jgi:hypothetical protein
MSCVFFEHEDHGEITFGRAHAFRLDSRTGFLLYQQLIRRKREKGQFSGCGTSHNY